MHQGSRKPIPDLRSEDEMREFWVEPGRDSTEYLDWSKARIARFPNVKLSTQAPEKPKSGK